MNMPIWKSKKNRQAESNPTVVVQDLFPDPNRQTAGEGSGTTPVDTGTDPVPSSRTGREGTQVGWERINRGRPTNDPQSGGPESGSDGHPGLGKDHMDNPVVGWLVIVDGPGKGSSHALGYQQNHIGRTSGRVILDFGDRKMSNSNHAVVTYDPKSRRWYIKGGDSINLTYLDGEPVLETKELLEGQKIGMGDTELVFVPFCGSEFDWQDQ
ncbi:MAG: FHA domain-containing protein [Magnetococcales bacterium]|nr:FHA domain-containing protein [Magnetococcales bacterium]